MSRRVLLAKMLYGKEWRGPLFLFELWHCDIRNLFDINRVVIKGVGCILVLNDNLDFSRHLDLIPSFNILALVLLPAVIITLMLILSLRILVHFFVFDQLHLHSPNLWPIYLLIRNNCVYALWVCFATAYKSERYTNFN